ncbi:MAG TPA: AMP-binding protein [Acidimicrobiales bacterium]|nr:AMP-binding protein [Acidimicrobiales bacterium]
MRTLLALDLALGPDLEVALRRCVEDGDAFCVIDQRRTPRGREEEIDRLGATAVLNANGRRERSAGRLVDDEIGLVMLTSGSSGEPKAAELSWDALRASADLTQTTLRGDARPVWLPCLPANHIGGLAVVLRAIFSDAALVWGDTNDLERGPREGATHVALVRTQLARSDVSGFYRVLLGGARPPGDLPDNVVTTWGMTETGSGVVYDGFALPGVDVAAVDGELCVRTPTLFRSYRSSPRPFTRGPDGRDDWFPTGDAGSVVNGRVRVRGRLAFVINTGGEKLWPEDLEAVLTSVDGVLDVAVTGVDDPEWGQRVVALVVGDGRRLDDTLRDAANDRLGPWAKPKEIRYVSAIPRTSNGKIRRGDLTKLS